MARELWLLRHGDAEDAGGASDADRALTARGEHQASTAGEALAELGVSFAAVFTSPRRRALDTARLVCRCLDSEPVVHEPLSRGFDRPEALALLEGHGDGAAILLVGHEPDLSQVVHDLTGAAIDLRKGGLAAVRVAAGSGDLIALLDPAALEAMGA